MKLSLTSIKFSNFKALGNFSSSFGNATILVGPNNAGKSTIINALRILESVLKYANHKSAQYIEADGRRTLGHKIPESIMPINLENIHTDYAEIDTKIEFKFSNSNKILVSFPEDGGCTLYWEAQGQQIKSPSTFKKAFPFSVQVIPVLGPLEQEEIIVTDETVKRSLGTPRASRHFRNYWQKNPEGFQDFKELVESTWPGMSIINQKSSPETLV